MTIVNEFFNNLFGTIGLGSTFQPTTANFIPVDSNGDTLQISGPTAQWMGMRTKTQQKLAYELCYPLACVVDKLADYDIAGEIEILRSKGKGKEDEATNVWAVKMRALLAQPNPLQTWEQFRAQQIVYKKIFGYCPVLPIIPIGFAPEDCVSMWNLPPWLFSAIPTGKLLYTTNINDIIKEYRLSILGDVIKLRADQVIILEDGVILDERESFLLPQSKLVGLDMAISNACAAMEADNVLLRKKGPLGFISHDAAASKDSVAGYLPMTKAQRNEVQENLSQYGMTWNQFQYVISRIAIKWNPISFKPSELETKETLIASEKAICHRFNLPYILYEVSGATYANGENAESAVYISNVIPNNKKDLNKYNKFFKAEENQCKIVGCFDDIAALQEDELNKNQAAKEKAQTMDIMYKGGIITKNQYLIEMGYPEIGPEGDQYYTAPAQPTNNSGAIQSDNNGQQNNQQQDGNQGQQEGQ